MATLIGKFYTDVSTPVSIDAGGLLPLQSSVVNNSYMSLSNNIISITRPGNYLVTVDTTLISTGSGEIEINLQSDGNNIPAATAAVTAGASDMYNTLSITVPVSVKRSFAGNVAQLQCAVVDATTMSNACITIISL